MPQVSDLTQSHLLSGSLGRRQSKQDNSQTAFQTQRAPQTLQRPYSILSQFQLFKFLCVPMQSTCTESCYPTVLSGALHRWLTHNGRVKEEKGPVSSPCILDDYFIVFNVATERNWSGSHYFFKEKINCPLLFKKSQHFLSRREITEVIHNVTCLGKLYL